MKATTVGEAEKKYKITLDAPKEMLLKTFLQNLGYKSLVESVAGMRTATEAYDEVKDSKRLEDEKHKEYVYQEILAINDKINAICDYLHISLHKTHGYSVFNHNQITTTLGKLSNKKWYEFWK